MDLSSVKKMLQQKSASLPANKKTQVTQQLAMMDQTEKMMAKQTISMELKKDGTVSISQAMGGKAETDKGKWTQSGNKVKMFGFSKGQGPKELSGVLSANGKSLIFDLSGEMNKEAAKKGAPAGSAGKMALNFTKN